MLRVLSRLFDLREGEGKVLAQAFFTLTLLIAGHTILETARDALFLAKLPPSRLTFVYAILAGVSFVTASWSAKLSRRFGRRNALLLSLVVAAWGTAVLYLQPATENAILGLYIFSGLVGSVLAAQFWLLAGQLFTVSQGRRLFGLVASGGVLGAIFGASLAAGLLAMVPVHALLLVSAGLFLATAVLLSTLTMDEPAGASPLAEAPKARGGMGLVRRDPYLMRLTALTVFSTAALLVLDYLFKASIAKTVAPERLGGFLARYYAGLNGVALLVQLFVASRIVRRLGVVGASTIMPFLLFVGALATFGSGGALAVVLATKGVDGGLRHSLHRVATELLFLPLDPEKRDRAKAVLDTVLVRVVQAAVAGGILCLVVFDLGDARILSAIVVFLVIAWLTLAVTMRRPYLDLFRNALAQGRLADDDRVDLDLDAVEALLEAMSDRDEARAVAAMNVLALKGRTRLIPSLVLLHESDDVVVRALSILSMSQRRDFIPLAERLLSPPEGSPARSDVVRGAAVRALAQCGVEGPLERAKDDANPAVRAYAAFYLAARAGVEPMDAPEIQRIVAEPSDVGRIERVALAEAIGDAPEARWANVLLAMAPRDGEVFSAQAVEAGSRAMARLGDPRFIGPLIQRLEARDARDAVREALVTFGDPALSALEAALDGTLDGKRVGRRVRLHIPRTIARFGTQRAADLLLARLESDPSGLIRYKVLRGLGRLVARTDVKLDHTRVEAAISRNLLEHLRVLSLLVPLSRSETRGEASPPSSLDAREVDVRRLRPRANRDKPRIALSWTAESAASARLLLSLLEDKARQAHERVFRLLQIAHKREDIHRAYLALKSQDRRARANAMEFLDTVTLGQKDPSIRHLLRIVIDDLDDAERVRRAAPALGDTPETYEDALRVLLRERDESLAAIAAHHAVSLGAESLVREVKRARTERPSLEAAGEKLMGLGGLTLGSMEARGV